MISLAMAFALQLGLGPAPTDTTRPGLSFGPTPRPTVETTIQYLRFDRLGEAPGPDTVKRQRRGVVNYSDNYYTRLKIHKVLSYAMIPLFIGSGYTGFQLRNKGDAAPKWTRDLHGPLAGATAIVFGMNTLTGVWNLIDGRKDPVDRKKRIIHSALFLAAAAGFTYVTIAGDDIHASGRGNHWHRDVALASMGVSVISWGIMTF